MHTVLCGCGRFVVLETNDVIRATGACEPNKRSGSFCRLYINSLFYYLCTHGRQVPLLAVYILRSFTVCYTQHTELKRYG